MVNYLGGKRVSELERAKSLEATDLFLISRDYNPATPNQHSKRVSAQTLIDDVKGRLDSNMFVGSIAFRDTTEYARKNHGHDYSNIRVYARPESFVSKYSPDGRTIQIGKFRVCNEGTCDEVAILCPIQQYLASSQKPRIGELKFLAVDTLAAVDVESEGFDGWVYPDGATYTKERFPDAWSVFAADSASSTFQVPLLDRFIRPNPFAYGGVATRNVPGSSTGIPSHAHDINTDQSHLDNVTIKASVKIPSTATDSGGSTPKAIHHATRISNSNDHLKSSQYSLKVTSFNMTTSGGELQSP